MGMNTRVVGFITPDEKWNRMKSVWDACIAADIEIPAEVGDFFNWEDPDPAGIEVDIEKITVEMSPHDCANGWEISLKDLQEHFPHVQKIRFVNSY